MAQTREVLDEQTWSTPDGTVVASSSFVVIETSREEEAWRASAAPPHVVLDIERHTPEGAGIHAHECRWLPLMMAALALLGITLVASVLGVAAGWRAGLLGAGAVMTGCAVGGIVVWGAGLMRRKEEFQINHEVEEHVLDRRFN